MARYIDADLLKECILGWYPNLNDEQLEHEIDTMPTADVAEVKWIDVKERLPNSEGSYLVCIIDDCGETRMEVMELLEWRNCFDWADHASSFWKEHNTITHWMPLPEPPSDAKMDGGKI